jgi:hypothetical protein
MNLTQWPVYVDDYYRYAWGMSLREVNFTLQSLWCLLSHATE